MWVKAPIDDIECKNNVLMRNLTKNTDIFGHENSKKLPTKGTVQFKEFPQ